MPERLSKKPGVNEMAANILDQVVGEPKETTPKGEKNPAAVALGRLGGLRGGKARADKLSKAKRLEIAKKAAAARWKKQR